MGGGGRRGYGNVVPRPNTPTAGRPVHGARGAQNLLKALAVRRSESSAIKLAHLMTTVQVFEPYESVRFRPPQKKYALVISR